MALRSFHLEAMPLNPTIPFLLHVIMYVKSWPEVEYVTIVDIDKYAFIRVYKHHPSKQETLKKTPA